MDKNAPPRPASTVLAVRDGDEGYEVLMVRRNLNSDFVGGAYVFPGGAVDPTDTEAARARGLDDDDASATLGVAAGGLVAALRELFEEAGLLIASDGAGAPIGEDPVRAAALSTGRRALNAGETTFPELLASTGAWLDLAGLAYLSHWVTPEGPPRRYDTRFFVVKAPEHQLAAHDEGETVAAVWIRPPAALAAHARGEFDMIFPTIRTLEAIEGFASAAEVIDFARSQASVTRVQPRIVRRDGEIAIVLPGEDGYDD
jgi:8-oxo-dGTP pyrophosphatase MutT (NUDIX family)